MSLISTNVVKKVNELRDLSKRCRDEIAAAGDDDMTKMFVMSAARTALVQALNDDLINALKGLQGSALGFKTDKDKDGGYSNDVIRQVAAQALILGLRMTDNEINIIAGNLYPAKNGCVRLCREFPRFSDDEFICGIPDLIYSEPIEKQGRNGNYTVQRCVAHVPCRIKYRINGKQHEIVFEGDHKIVCKIDGAAEDAAIGKAERKAYMRLYKKLTGMSLGAEEEGDTIDVVATVETEEEKHERMLAEFRDALKQTQTRAEVTETVEYYKTLGLPQKTIDVIRKEGEKLYKQLAS